MCNPTWTVVSDVIRTLTPVVALGMVAAGWFLVNRQNNFRESRKETRQLIDRTLNRLQEAVDVATKYQCGASDEKLRHVDCWKVLLALEQISSNIENLRRRKIDTRACNAPFITLKRCITGHDFMTKNWQPWQPDDKRWLELLAATDNLSKILERLFIDNFSE